MTLQIEGDAQSGYSMRGNLTYETVPELFGKNLQFAAETRIDLDKMERIDSAGLALLVEWSCEARRRNGCVILEHIPDSLKLLIDVSNLRDVLSIAND